MEKEVVYVAEHMMDYLNGGKIYQCQSYVQECYNGI